jgi:cytochrome c2
MNLPRFHFFQPSRLRWLQRSRAFSFFLGTIFALATLTRAAGQSADGPGADYPGPFFEPHFPFYQSTVELPATATGKEQIVVRGILLPMPNGLCVLFDQELLRVAALWKTEPGAPWITLRNMAQVSYAEMHRKAAKDRPVPVGRVQIQSDALPGVAALINALGRDPRAPARPGESGRGPLPPAQWRYEGITLTSQTAIVRYRTGQTPVREWFTPGACEESVLRIWELGEHSEPLHFSLGSPKTGQPWQVQNGNREARSGDRRIEAVGCQLSIVEGRLVATVGAGSGLQRAAVGISFGKTSSALPADWIPGPPPQPEPHRRWPQPVTAPVQNAVVDQNGLVFDQFSVPEENPWKRRVRPSDVAFLGPDRAAVVTYEGDLWIVDGLNQKTPTKTTWHRFATGLHEAMAIAAPGGVIQVATKNGVLRVVDEDGNGEADRYDNFCDLLLQSQTTRSFPLDMAIAPDGSTLVTQGGIVDQSGIGSGGSGTPHTGAIVRIAPDGRAVEVIAEKTREAYVAVHPETGLITATDQQGHFVPTSPCYLVKPGDSFGFGEEKPKHLTPPLVWIPHPEDNSSASQVWVDGKGMGPWDGRLLHLSYGTGKLFLICPDLDGVAQGAVIPTDFPTQLPLLHGRMHPSGNAVFLAGFQIYDSRAGTRWALGRLRSNGAPIGTAMSARSLSDGVVLEFASALDPASVQWANVRAMAWNYQRGKQYGSGRYDLEGQPGTTPWPVGTVALSEDHKSVFVHLPALPAVMQLQVGHSFRLANGSPAEGRVYFTIHEPRPMALQTRGFKGLDLSRSEPKIQEEKSTPVSAEEGLKLSATLGCVGCHSADGATEGKSGPTWKGLLGRERWFTDGSNEIANDFYLRDSILEPNKKVVTGYPPGMPSYKGVLTDRQLEALVMYLKTLK